MIYESVRELFKYGEAIQHHAFFKFSAQNVGPPNLFMWNALPNKYKLLHVYFEVQKCTSFLQRLHMWHIWYIISMHANIKEILSIKFTTMRLFIAVIFNRYSYIPDVSVIRQLKITSCFCKKRFHSHFIDDFWINEFAGHIIYFYSNQLFKKFW